MKPYNETTEIAPGITRTIYPTPTGRAVTTATEGFILAISLTIVVLIIGNVAAVAFHAWDSDVFWNSVLIALFPWGLLVLAFGLRLYRYALPKVERAVKRDLDGDGYIGEPIRFITLKSNSAPRPLQDGEVYPQDLEYFIEQITNGRDHTQREWYGEQLPSGITCYNDYYAALIQPLVQAAAIIERTAGAKGRLVVHNADHLKRMVGL